MSKEDSEGLNRKDKRTGRTQQVRLVGILDRSTCEEYRASARVISIDERNSQASSPFSSLNQTSASDGVKLVVESSPSLTSASAVSPSECP